MEPLQSIALALGLGLLIGLQREHVHTRIGGIRTFPLVSLFGALCGLLARHYTGWVVAVGFLGVVGMLAFSNYLRAGETDTEPGQTTEVAMLLTFGLGAFVIEGSKPAAVVMSGLVIILLHLKQPMHRFVHAMGERDMRGIMQFVVISLIVLPLLPDRAYGPYRVLNPFDIWRMVVLIVGISLAGYVAYKIIGEKAGTVLGGISGGMISSTATTVSYARRAGGAPAAATWAVIAIMMASTIAYVRVLIELGVVASSNFGRLAPPFFVMLVWMIGLSLASFFLHRSKSSNLPNPSNPAELKGALIFGCIYAVVLFAVAAIKNHFGSTALYGVAVVSGLTDMDAITLSLSRMVNEERLDPHAAWRLILIASLSNMAFKWAIATFLGGWSLGVRLGIWFAAAAGGGLAIFLLWPEDWSSGQAPVAPGRSVEN